MPDEPTFIDAYSDAIKIISSLERPASASIYDLGWNAALNRAAAELTKVALKERRQG